MTYSLLQLPVNDRPRERILRYGPETMSTQELIAILLGTAIKGMPVLQLAHELLIKFGSLQKLTEATIEELCTIKGLGQAKAIQLKAAFSIGIRASRQASTLKARIEHLLHAYHLIKDELELEKRELFILETAVEDDKLTQSFEP